MNMKMLYRHFSIDRALNEETRTKEIVFSTENPVESYYGAEILLHGKKNVNLSRLETGAVLFNHDPDNIIGPILSMSLKNFSGVAEIGFDDDEMGNMALGKVRSGSLRGVSVGYTIDKAVRIYEKETYPARAGFEIQGPALIATRWTPHEVTLTPIPADKGAGVRMQMLDGVKIVEARHVRKDIEQIEFYNMKYGRQK
jgi:phage head maturation protease